MDSEIFKLLEASVANIHPGHSSLRELRRDQLLAQYDKAEKTLRSLIKAKEHEIAYRRSLIDMLEKFKPNKSNDYETRTSLDRRLSEFLKTFPNLGQAGMSAGGDETQIIEPMAGYYTQQHPQPSQIQTQAPPPPMMAMLRFPPPTVMNHPPMPNDQL